MVLLEAMAAGCPIVATDVGGNYMAVKHGVNGSLIKPKDSIKFAYEVMRLLKDRYSRMQYSKNGIKVFHEKFSADIMTRKYEKLYLRET